MNKKGALMEEKPDAWMYARNGVVETTHDPVVAEGWSAIKRNQIALILIAEWRDARQAIFGAPGASQEMWKRLADAEHALMEYAKDIVK